jgi:hypothetical protein
MLVARTTRAALRARAALQPGGAQRFASAAEFPGDAATTVRAVQRARRAHSSATRPRHLPLRPQSYLRNLSNGAELYLVGTAHVSRKSAEEASAQCRLCPRKPRTDVAAASSALQVRRVIRAVQPGTVVVELCDARAARLMSPHASKPSTLADALAALGAPGSLTSKLLGLGMKGFYAAWRHAGLEPGLEFKARALRTGSTRLCSSDAPLLHRWRCRRRRCCALRSCTTPLRVHRRPPAAAAAPTQ